MRKILTFLCLPGLVLAKDPGELIIVGGALTADNAAIYREFTEAVGRTGRIAVITAASAAPIESAVEIQRTFEQYGVVTERIVHVQLALTDDLSTPLSDERDWSENAFDPEEIARLTKVQGIWFGNGDQRRLADALMDDGAATPMLRMLRSRHKAGAVVGGTSAGAAIMSNPMFVNGESLPSLLAAPNLGDQLELADGFGFFSGGLIDQHFDARARLGRLALALGNLPATERVGVGIDENTALVVDGTSWRVVGDGHVSLLDGREADWTTSTNGIAITGLRLSILSPGDRYYADRQVINPARYLRPLRGNAYFQTAPQRGGGIALPGGHLSQRLGENLVDNAATEEFSTLSFALSDTRNGRGVDYRFAQTPETRGYWGRDENGQQRYTLLELTMDVVPFRLRLEQADAP